MEGKEKKRKKKDNTQRIVAKNAEVKVKIKSPVKKDIRGGKKSSNSDEEKNRKEQTPIKRKASKSPEKDSVNKEKKEPANKTKRLNEAHNDVTSSVAGPERKNSTESQKDDRKEAVR